MNSPEKIVIPDVQSTADTRHLAIDKVGMVRSYTNKAQYPNHPSILLPKPGKRCSTSYQGK